MGDSSRDRDDVLYSECIGRSLLHGLGTGTLTFAAVYLGQKSFTRGMKFKGSNPQPMVILSSTIFSCLTAYLINKEKIVTCNKNFHKSGFVLEGLKAQAKKYI